MSNFDLKVTCQSILFFEKTKKEAANKLIIFSKNNTNLARFTGLPIAICQTLFDLAQYIASIGEALIKSIGNLILFPFVKDASVLKGVKQLFIQLPNSILNLAFWPLSSGLDLALTPIGMLALPKAVLEYKWEISANKKCALKFIVKNPIPSAQVSDTIETKFQIFKLRVLELLYV